MKNVMIVLLLLWGATGCNKGSDPTPQEPSGSPTLATKVAAKAATLDESFAAYTKVANTVNISFLTEEMAAKFVAEATSWPKRKIAGVTTCVGSIGSYPASVFIENNKLIVSILLDPEGSRAIEIQSVK